MQTYAQIEELYMLKKVGFYSIRLEDEVETEMEKFISKFRADPIFYQDYRVLAAWIKRIGNEEGALPGLFRDEDDAQALPPEFRAMEIRGMLDEVGYDLRLYCLRLSNEVVILLNGGVKESQKTQDSPDLLPKFRLANRVSKAVTQKIIRRELMIQGKQLKGDFELIF